VGVPLYKRKNSLAMQDYIKTKFIILLDNVEIGNFKKKNWDHKKVPKQDEDTDKLQFTLHLRSLF